MTSQQSSEELLRVRGLTAGYRRTIVLSGVSFTVRRGEILAVLGANGSGKTTLLRTITGQQPLVTGTVHIVGMDISRSPEIAKSGFGYAVDPYALPYRLTGSQYLELVASIRRCRPHDWSVPGLLDRLELKPWLSGVIGEYSFGTRMKLSIAAALLGHPPLIILDESLNGLDPVIAHRVKVILSTLVHAGGHALILATHELEVAARLCTSAILLMEGRVGVRWEGEGLQNALRAPGGFEAAVLAALGEPNWETGGL